VEPVEVGLPDGGLDHAIDVPVPVDLADPGKPDPGKADPGKADPGKDADPGVNPGDVADTPAPDATDPGPDSSPCPGATGCACAAASDCESGFCVDTFGGRACSRVCGIEAPCPAGWECSSTTGPDGPVNVCVGPFLLCRPCSADPDCGKVSSGNRCVEAGPDGRFCGLACAADAGCPDGFACDAGQCRPSNGAACPCPEAFRAAGYSTECYRQNAFGTCRAQRTCDVACPAPEPAAETCDGKDQDCDGETDEGFPDLDGDKLADCVDPDADGDDVPNDVDVCPYFFNPGQDPADCLCDRDGDGIANDAPGCPPAAPSDNCPDVPNPDQADLDNDGDGDACDGDRDGDGDPNDTDCGPDDPAVFHGQVEVCDGRDEDCDGVPDDGLGTISCGVGACKATVERCQDGQLVGCTPNPPGTETCNGLDDDCDGETDEGLPPTISCGKGPCARTVIACVGGIPQECVPGPPSPETCNGKDDDCNDVTDETCPCPVKTFGGHAYEFCTAKAKWTVARDSCQSHGGYHLVTISSAEENKFVFDTAWSFRHDPWWTGMNDRKDEKKWVWDNGEPVTFTAWHSGEPNNAGYNEDCLDLLVFGLDYTWNDERCEEFANFVCEHE
jgi:hypothetical protein